MKKLTTLLAVMAIVFGLSGKAQAVPYYYTFVGTVSSMMDDAGAIYSQLPYVSNDYAIGGIGATVEYWFIVDLDADGTRTLNDGTVTTYSDDADFDYFYADYFSGDALVQVDGGVWNDPPNVAEYNVGYDNVGCDGIIEACGLLSGNSDDDYFDIYSASALVSDWAVGTSVWSRNGAYDSIGNYSYLEAALTLTDISPVNQVPEPSTLLLLGSGLFGFGFFRRKSAIA